MIGNGFGETAYSVSDSSNYMISFQKMEQFNLKSVRMAIKGYYIRDRATKIDETIKLIASTGYNVIINSHNFPGDDGYFGSQQWRDDWIAIATRYKDNKNVVGYELFNEPWVNRLWDPSVKDYPDILKAYKRCTTEVRAIDNSKTIIWGDPMLCNLLPKEDGFLGWFGDVIGQYSGMNITFALHRYPPMEPEAGKPWTGYNWLPKAVDYLKAKGFRVWLGEFGPLKRESSGGVFSYEENKQFVVTCINMCISKGIPFSFWHVSLDHYEEEGFYEACLLQSNYSSTPKPEPPVYNGVHAQMFPFPIVVAKLANYRDIYQNRHIWFKRLHELLHPLI